MESSIILTNEQIKNKTRRIAYQIYETNCNEKEIIIAGINGNGYVFAQNIATILNEIAELNVIKWCDIFSLTREFLYISMRIASCDIYLFTIF